MRYGCCANLLCGGPGGASGTGVAFVERIAAAGFDYVEMPLGVIAQMPDAAFGQLVERVAHSGIRCETCTNLFPATLRVTGPDIDEAAIGQYATAALTRARRLGADCIVFGSGRSRNVPESFDRTAAWAQLVHLLQRLAPLAEASGLDIAIEPLRRQESNILNTYGEACRLAQAVARPSIRALVDYYHLATECEPADAIVAGAKWLRHVHFASLEGRRFPSGQNEGKDSVSVRDFFRALKSASYDGRISLEAFTDDFDREAGPALRFLRQRAESAEPPRNCQKEGEEAT